MCSIENNHNEYIKSLKEKINSFLVSKDRNVLLVKGKWGVGKTFFWKEQYINDKKKFLIENPSNNKIKAYSYISLFGLKSSQEISEKIISSSIFSPQEINIFTRIAIYLNLAAILLLTISLLGFTLPSISSIKSFVTSPLVLFIFLLIIIIVIAVLFYKNTYDHKPKIMNVLLLASKIGWIKQQLGDSSEFVVSSLIKDHLICIDDIERKHKDLDLNEIAGYIDYLVEQKNCKVVIIINIDELDDKKYFNDLFFDKLYCETINYIPENDYLIDFVFKESRLVNTKYGSPCNVLKNVYKDNDINVRKIKRMKYYMEILHELLDGNYDLVVKEIECTNNELSSYLTDSNIIIKTSEDIFSCYIQYTFLSENGDNQSQKISDNLEKAELKELVNDLMNVNNIDDIFKDKFKKILRKILIDNTTKIMLEDKQKEQKLQDNIVILPFLGSLKSRGLGCY